MSGLVRRGGALAVTVLLLVPAQAQDLKPWRQAMIIPKADAGFFLMAAKRGFAEREGLHGVAWQVHRRVLAGDAAGHGGARGAGGGQGAAVRREACGGRRGSR